MNAVVIDRAGVYDIPAEVYHADPVPGGSLSSTGARKLLPPSCPALYRHWIDTGEAARHEWDIGHAAHLYVLGAGPELVVVDRDRWDTNEVKAEVKAIRDRGAVPLKRAAHEMVQAMAGKLRRHPWASALFAPGTGRPEQTIVWQDKATGVWCRALLDWLPNPTSGRFIYRDYKTATTKSASPAKLDRTIDDFGYHVQAAFHLAGLRALGLAGEDAQALIVMQSKEPPYLVLVAQPDHNAMRIGAIQVREALRVFAECRAAAERGDPDPWPSWSNEVVLVSLPPWTEREFEEVR